MIIEVSLVGEIVKKLIDLGYFWEPQTPDLLLKFRKNSTELNSLVKYFSLGLKVTKNELINDGVDIDLASKLPEIFPFSIVRSEKYGMFFHDHWPPKNEYAQEYVHLGPESFEIAEELFRNKEQIKNKSILDLGCSSGVLSFVAQDCGATRVVGIDQSKKAVELARCSSLLRGARVDFFVGKIGTEETEKNINEKFDYVIFNPPLAVPSGESEQPHRDGGVYGIEIPLLFLEFALKKLKSDGEIWFIAGCPKVDGKDIFTEKLKQKKIKIISSKIIKENFNQALARKHKYSEKGIHSIELRLYKVSV